VSTSHNDPAAGPDYAALANDVAGTRAQLFETLDAIEEWFDVPKQLGALVHRARRDFDARPVPYVTAALAGSALLVGGIVVSVVRRR
jgi:hypothetical protein